MMFRRNSLNEHEQTHEQATRNFLGKKIFRNRFRNFDTDLALLGI